MLKFLDQTRRRHGWAGVTLPCEVTSWWAAAGATRTSAIVFTAPAQITAVRWDERAFVAGTKYQPTIRSIGSVTKSLQIELLGSEVRRSESETPKLPATTQQWAGGQACWNFYLKRKGPRGTQSHQFRLGLTCQDPVLQPNSYTQFTLWAWAYQLESAITSTVFFFSHNKSVLHQSKNHLAKFFFLEKGFWMMFVATTLFHHL